jgi:multiple antibiotic resistance protein
MSKMVVYDFVTLFVMLDPVGMLAVFLAVTADLEPAQRRQAALLGVAYSFVVLLFFIVAGELLLIEMGIPLRAFQIAGGILVLLYGIEMCLGSSAPGISADQPIGTSIHALAVYPLAIPAIAGPGAMLTTVLLTDNRLYGFWEQALTTAVLAVVLAIFFVILLFANPIMKLIGQGGANVLRRVMGILLSAIAIKMVLTAFQAWLGLPEL